MQVPYKIKREKDIPEQGKYSFTVIDVHNETKIGETIVQKSPFPPKAMSRFIATKNTSYVLD